MDTQARLEVARERLAEGRSLLLKAKEAGSPCQRCAFHEYRSTAKGLALFCSSPVYASPQFDPASGKLSEKGGVPASDARADDGLCGPEAALFEKRPFDRTTALIGLAVLIGGPASLGIAALLT